MVKRCQFTESPITEPRARTQDMSKLILSIQLIHRIVGLLCVPLTLIIHSCIFCQSLESLFPRLPSPWAIRSSTPLRSYRMLICSLRELFQGAKLTSLSPSDEYPSRCWWYVHAPFFMQFSAIIVCPYTHFHGNACWNDTSKLSFERAITFAANIVMLSSCGAWACHFVSLPSGSSNSRRDISMHVNIVS